MASDKWVGGGGGGGSGGGGGGGKKYEDLEKDLLSAFKDEWEGLDGTKPRQFFSDRLNKSSYKELFEMFQADPHDSEWSSLIQDKHGNFTKIATHARATGYIDSMWRELHQLYLVNEINSLDEERNAVGKWLYQDPEILEFLKPKD